MSLTLLVGEVSVPCRKVTVGEQTFSVPRGIARNTRNRAWQLKVKRGGELKASGNFADDTFNGTAEALEKAIDRMTEVMASNELPVAQTIKISQRLSLIWTMVGSNVLGVSATVYNPDIKKGNIIYLISQKKAAAGFKDELKVKLIKAFTKEWSIEYSDREMTAADTDRISGKASEFLESQEWAEFLKLGARLANNAEKLKIE